MNLTLADKISMDTSILNLYQEGIISKETAIAEAVNPDIMKQRINLRSF